MNHCIELLSQQQTESLGEAIGRTVEPGDIITLGGTLGAGKTTLTQAIGRGLGVPPDTYITSPTFTLLHEYHGSRLPLYHMDFYRLGSEDEIESAGLLEYLYDRGVAVIEWPERLGSLMPSERLHVDLIITGETSRTADLYPYGDAWQKKVADIISMV